MVSASPFTPPSQITVQMYRLEPTGVIYQPEELCSSGNTNYGCTAFVGDYNHPYPYGSANPATVLIETDYLLDVVPREMGPAQYHSTALEAQAIAARSYAYWHIQHGSDINNSTDFQVFVPYYFEYMSGIFPDNPENPCASTNLHEYQEIVCNAVASRYYISYGDDSPAFTEYFADRLYRTVSGDPSHPYLQGVENPISIDCDADDDGHGRGMSQEGASRWARGNLCANINNPGEEWSVRWDDYRQILVHYYTGIHIRDAADGSYVTPNLRWNMLEHNIPANVIEGYRYPFTVTIQNTSTENWTEGNYSLGYRWCLEGGSCTDWVTVPLHPAPEPEGQAMLERGPAQFEEGTPTPEARVMEASDGIPECDPSQPRWGPWPIEPGELGVAEFNVRVPQKAWNL